MAPPIPPPATLRIGAAVGWFTVSVIVFTSLPLDLTCSLSIQMDNSNFPSARRRQLFAVRNYINTMLRSRTDMGLVFARGSQAIRPAGR